MGSHISVESKSSREKLQSFQHL